MRALALSLCLSIFLSYGGFSQAYFLNGDAQFLGGDCYQLTTQANFQNGTVWYGQQINLLEPFDFTFTMNFGTTDANGADGMCFVLQTVGTAAIGSSGGGLGYQDFGTSLGVEFDTWQNGDFNDPFADHIAIEKNGDINHNSASNIAGPIQANPFNQNIEDGEDHVVRILWDPESNTIEVYFDCVFRLAGNVNLIDDIFSGQSLVYWGFTAATGGSFNNQTVCLQPNIVTSASEVAICTGASATLSAGSSFDGVYQWSPGTYLSDSTGAVVVATPAVSTVYTVNYINLCGDSSNAQINVVVAPLEITMNGLLPITCINPAVELAASANILSMLEYDWVINGNTVLTGNNENQLIINQQGAGTLYANYDSLCFAQVDFNVVNDFSTYDAFAGSDTVLNCYNPSVVLLGATNNALATVNWALNNNPIFGATSLSYTANTAGTYTLVVLNPSNGCIDSDTLVVAADFNSPEVTIGLQDTLNCLQPTIVLQNVDVNSLHNYQSLWNTADGNIVAGINTISPTVNMAGWYEVIITDIVNGCTDSVEVNVQENTTLNLDPSFIQFPNVFSPNNDEKNASWHPFLINDPGRDIAFFFSSYDLKIYNRWGNIIFDSTNANNSWRGEEQDEGVYFYHIAYSTFCSNGKKVTREGNIHLLR